ncbi:MAG: hypothetical protein MUC88_24590 [Planctomycetes bacterium]|jgi:hypothetical protein|nr:hypothetical protein [Planctomycetota bacterium]
MHKKSSTFGLPRDQLAELWTLGEDLPPAPAAPGPAPDRTSLLRTHLAESLPLEAGLARLLPKILTAVCEKLQPFAGGCCGVLLVNPQTELSVLRAIKDLHKQRAAAAEVGPLQDVAAAIYYAAIASALVHHAVRITKLSYDSLARSFASLSQSDWLPPDLQTLLTQAHQECLRHVK